MEKGNPILLLLVFLVIVTGKIDIQAQESTPTLVESDIVSAGIGGGLDYGGFGINLLIYPQKNIGVFGGVGYALASTGYNVGVKLRFISKKNRGAVDPYFMGMYGYNTSVSVSGAAEYNKLFYGLSFGGGIDLRINRAKSGYWTFALIVPIRGSEVDEYINNLKANPNIEFHNELLPIAFSVGYRLIIN